MNNTTKSPLFCPSEQLNIFLKKLSDLNHPIEGIVVPNNIPKMPPFRVSPCGRYHHYNYYERLTLQYAGFTRIRDLEATDKKYKFIVKHVTPDFKESPLVEHEDDYSYEDKPFWRMKEVTDRIIDGNLAEVSEEEKNREYFVCFTEGEKDALALVGLGFEASCPFSSGGLSDLDVKHLAMLNARIVLFWDRDETGEKRRDKNVERLRGKVGSLRVVDLPEGFKDVAEYIEAGHGENVQRLIDQAEFIEGVEGEVVMPGEEIQGTWAEETKKTRIPIGGKETKAVRPFPIDALIPVLRDMVVEMADCSVQAPLENCAGTVLSVSSFVLGNRVEVFLNEMVSHFLSFIFLIIGESGERKSAMVKEAMNVIAKLNKKKMAIYEAENLCYQNHLNAFEAKKREVEKSIEPGSAITPEEEKLEKMREDLKRLEPIPPKKYTNKGTIAGIRKKLAACKGWGYICSAEAKPMINYLLGKGDGTDGSTNLSPFLSWNWGEDQSQTLGGKTDEGSFISVENPALSMFLCTQHATAEKFLNHPDVREEGMLGRIWVIEGGSKIGDQEWHPKRKNRAAKDAYENAIKTAYEAPTNERVRVVLQQGSEAEQAVIAFHKKMQKSAKNQEKRSSYRGIYCKAVSQVGKVAALFEYYKELLKGFETKLFPNQTIQVPLSLDSIERAVKMVEWLLEATIQRLKEQEEDQATSIAKKCCEKIREKEALKGKEFTKREFQRAFNYHFKNLKENPTLADDVLEILVEYRWIEVVPGKLTSKKGHFYRAI